MTGTRIAFAAPYWGFVFATALVGISIVQGYIYFVRNRRGPWAVKSFVILLLVLDPATTMLTAQTLYYYFLVNFGNNEVFAKITTSWSVENALTAFIVWTTQLYFATKIYQLNKQHAIFPRPFLGWMIPAIVVLLAFIGFTAGIIRTVYLFIQPTDHLIDIGVQLVAGMEEGSESVCDIITTIIFCYIYSSTNARTQADVTSRRYRVKTASTLLIDCGILVTIVQIGTFVTYLSVPEQLYWMPFHFCKSKVYINTFLAMLNSRDIRRVRQNNPQSSKLEFRRTVVTMPVINITVNHDSPSASAEDTEKNCTGVATLPNTQSQMDEVQN